MLTQKESSQLLEILSAVPFEVAAGTFQRTFVRADHFRVAAALCLMLDDDVLRPHHRLTAMYVIHDVYKNELPSVHPFMPFLVNTLQQSQQTDAKEAQPAERKLLCLLLAQPPSKDLPKKAPSELSSLGPAPLPNLLGLVRSYAERDKQVDTLRRRRARLYCGCATHASCVCRTCAMHVLWTTRISHPRARWRRSDETGCHHSCRTCRRSSCRRGAVRRRH